MVTTFRLAWVAALLFLASCSTGRIVDSNCDPQTATRRYSAPWAELTEAQLREEVERACGRVSIGFKEAEAARGVDEQGRVLTAPGTVARMKAYLVNLGVALELEYELLPAVVARMPARQELVAELRSHPNVDYLEPAFPGTRSGR